MVKAVKSKKISEINAGGSFYRWS